jgi:hypothetical protein
MVHLRGSIRTDYPVHSHVHLLIPSSHRNYPRLQMDHLLQPACHLGHLDSILLHHDLPVLASILLLGTAQRHAREVHQSQHRA